MINYDGKLIVIAGATASGKSDIAIRLAKDIGGYIVNGDSRQIYKYLDIGTAKPTPDKVLSDGSWIVDGIRHYLFSFVDPKDSYTLYDYQHSVQEILNREEGIPILTGGTGLYIDSVVFNYNLKQNTSTLDLSSYSVKQLQDMASKYLPDMTVSDRENRHRLERVIEREGLGKERGDELQNMYFVLDVQRDVLKKRIKERIERMFKMGLERENRKLLDMGYTYSDRALNSIGYREFEGFFNGEDSIEVVKESIYRNTLAYAKRQRTWFKRNKGSVCSNDYESILDLASNFITGE
ncbi:MAG: tRNA (adenosine(37)-N6)-dimethylallyltransferase MiaA [Candidatus Dojkabacteria bacterium]|jgi:tRNA dimethylallyltransferase|nr:tRNA (adenosine(37)-N6)-dimethylallyltransferase MiaA [Candidatus Dojkabacteria bacterium]